MLFKTSIKKCFILTALLMLLTGCTINYNLTIDNNYKEEEEKIPDPDLIN